MSTGLPALSCSHARIDELPGESRLVVPHLAENCKTVLMGYRPVPSKEVLLRIIAKLGGSVADAEIDIRRWNRGSVWIDLSEGQSKYFGITSGKYPSSCPRELDGETKLLLRKGCEVTL